VRLNRHSQGTPNSGSRAAFVIRHSSFVICRRGFTLIELILVMTVLTIVVSITAPALANFFHGRTLDSEARRLLALTRHGQSRAVSEGIPMELWMDTAKNSFGLEAEPSYETEDGKAVELTLDGDIQLQVVNSTAQNSTASPRTLMTAGAASATPLVSRHPDVPKIRFLPDGAIAETSPQALTLTGRDGNSICIQQARSRLNYEIRPRSN
jgi:prepilin-type N-terminal cleavage/methylation domain-containing protein